MVWGPHSTPRIRCDTRGLWSSAVVSSSSSRQGWEGFGAWGGGVWGMGLRVQVAACRGFKVWGLGSRVWLPLILLPLYISIQWQRYCGSVKW